MKEYSICPKCSNAVLTLNLGNDFFERACSCGWKVKILRPDESEQLPTRRLVAAQGLGKAGLKLTNEMLQKHQSEERS